MLYRGRSQCNAASTRDNQGNATGEGGRAQYSQCYIEGAASVMQRAHGATRVMQRVKVDAPSTANVI
ncbi:hypothetical protein NDU88_008090 [Pleurodeles waltl]|uniref:Pectinesterase n=1 Tax=Pleurodeles waltl TaxID=8319 RepID=A0AAV7U220_PLEWA|nr:hypothetical protein NDU88_008090 [Pleurodeles waltl]